MRTALRILSGGQTGVDRAALDAALAAGLPCGGWCPKGRAAEDGPIPARYPLRETAKADPAFRTRANVADADAVLIVADDAAPETWGPGTRLAAAEAARLVKPLRVLVLGDGGDGMPALRAWLREGKIRLLNVAGPRESESPGIGGRARKALAGLFSAL